MLINGSEILVQCLKEQGVDVIFGYPGGSVLNIYDALYKEDGIKHYLVSHEQHAAHAADGYARSTGKVGVCLATSGPGATNLVTGIATAYMDSVPMVAITGNVGLPLLGKDSFQEVDIAGITIPITKYSMIVKDVTLLAESVRKAFYIAKEGRPGPVLIDITKDVTAAMCEYEPEEPKKVTRKTELIREHSVEAAADLISRSERPLIFAGGGVIIADAAKELADLAEKADAPVCLSAMGLGAFAADSPRYTGMLGMHGTKASNLAAAACDLLVAVGVRFSDRVVTNAQKFVPNAKIIHIDVDAAEIGKNVTPALSIIGDAKEALTRLTSRTIWCSHSAWKKKIADLIPPEQPFTDNVLTAKRILSKVSELARDAIVVTEVGQHQMWACQYVKRYKPRTFLTSGGLGTMGYGLGAAIGAAVANPNTTVINIAGDGCFRMNNIELSTAVAYNLPVITIILNNHTLGMVRQWQTLFYDKRYAESTLTERGADFAQIADAYGAVGISAATPEDFDAAFTFAMKARRPVVINCEIGMDEKVFPMVPGGKGIDEMMEE